jgi:hypothetical protein
MQVYTCVILFVLATTLTIAQLERIQLKGNLLFTELGGQSLNQEYVIFVRSLNTSDLRLLAIYLRQSIDLYHSFCDQAQMTLELAQNKTRKFHSESRSLYHYILSGSKYQLRDAPSVCRALNAQLLEVRDIKDLQQLQDFLNGTGVWRVLARLHYSKPTNKFQFDSDSMNIRTTELFPFAQYGGSYTGGYHQADWEQDKWLTKEAQSFPLQYEVTTQKVIVRVSDVRERFEFRNLHCLPKTKCVQCPL